MPNMHPDDSGKMLEGLAKMDQGPVKTKDLNYGLNEFSKSRAIPCKDEKKV